MMKSSKILVVEDDGIVANDLRFTLERYGYTVCSIVSTGEEAIKKSEEEKPDLVLMDIMLKGRLDGIEAANEIRRLLDIPVVYLTAYSDEKLLERAGVTEPFGYLVKPFGERELHSTIEMALYNYRIALKIKEHNEWLNTTLKSIGDGVIATDPYGNVKFMNNVAQVLTGWREEDALGRPINEIFRLINEETGEEEPLSVVKVLKSGETIRITDHILSKNGEKISIADSVSPIKDNKGNVIGLVLVFTDITERRKAEKILKEYSKTLEAEVEKRIAELQNATLISEAANRAKSDFLANMSHELRTPLNTIIGFSEIMFEGITGDLPGTQKEYIRDIYESGKHLLSLIDEILDLSKIEAGGMGLELSEFNLKDTIEWSLAVFRENAIKHNIDIKTEIGDEIGNIIADRRKIKHVLYNLLSNAIKFTPDGGYIHLAVRRVMSSEFSVCREEKTVAELRMPDTEQEFVEITIEDTGIGISKEDQAKIFLQFQQVEPHLTKKYPGTGLGLYFSKRLVELHGGRIYVESKIGEGSKFTLVIPVVFGTGT